jgi:hypothetical protein
MDIADFIVGVTSGLAVNFIWLGLKEFASLGPLLTRNPDIRGKWIGSYVENGNELQEEIEVTKQFLRYIHGTFISNENGQVIKYKISGEFVFHNRLIVKFVPENNIVTDAGVAMFEISHDGNSGTGGSISFNFETKNLEPREYTMRRQQA